MYCVGTIKIGCGKKKGKMVVFMLEVTGKTFAVEKGIFSVMYYVPITNECTLHESSRAVFREQVPLFL